MHGIAAPRPRLTACYAFRSPIVAFHRSLSTVPPSPIFNRLFPSLNFPNQTISARPSRRRYLVALAEDNDGGRGREDKDAEEKKDTLPSSDGDLRQVLALGIRWRDLLDPDPANIVAVGLTGLLALASVQALWQLFIISIAILLAALKYSFVAALLLFIVITLL